MGFYVVHNKIWDFWCLTLGFCSTCLKTLKKIRTFGNNDDVMEIAVSYKPLKHFFERCFIFIGKLEMVLDCLGDESEYLKIPLSL